MDKPVNQYHSSNVRVLHVDDEPMICDVTRLCLERGGRFNVDTVHTAEEALALLKESPYACVISDYEMPAMNGIELLREIRTFDPEIPFILFSGKGRETVIIDAINTGADFFIQKGGDAKSLFAELNHKVDYAITKRNARISLKRRDAILEAVSLVATLFLGGEPFPKAMRESVALFGLATEVDRVMTYRLYDEPDQSFFHCMSTWNRPDACTNDMEISVLPVNSFSFIEKILNGEAVIGSTDYFDDATAILLEHQNIKSIAVFPVIADQKIRGMIMFCDCLFEREWPIVEVDALQAAVSIIGSAIHQDEMRSENIDGKEQYQSMYSMMRQLCDAVPDMLWAKDIAGKYIFVNKVTANELLGVSDTDEPIGKHESEYITLKSISPVLLDPIPISGDISSPRSIEPVIEIAEQIMTGETKNRELEIRSVPFYNGSGQLIGTVSVGRDVTEASDAERKVHAERNRYLRIFRSINIGLISCNTNGTISEMNSRASDLLGLNSNERKGLNLHTLKMLEKSNLIYDFSEAIKNKQPIHGIEEFPDKKGSLRQLYYAITPHLDIDAAGVIDLILTIDEHCQD